MRAGWPGVDDDYRPRRLPLPRQSQVFFFLILAVMFYLSWLVFANFIIYIIAAIFVAVLALPIDKFWEKFFPNHVAALCTMISLFAIVTVPLVLLGAAMYNDVVELTGSLEGKKLDVYVDNALEKQWARDALTYFYPDQNSTELNATARALVSDLKASATGTLQEFGNQMLLSLPDLFIGLSVILFVVYYVLVDGERFVAYLRRAAPLPARQVDFLLHEARGGLTAVFSGSIVVSVLQGVLGGIGFALPWVNLPNPVLWGAVMALFALLPVIGTFMIWIPAAIYLFATGNVLGGIFTLIWGFFVVTFFMENIFKPKLIGRTADIHPMFVLVGVLGGVAVFGFIGLFLGPLLVGVTVAFLSVFEKDYLDPQVNLIDELEMESQSDEPVESADPDTAPPT